MESVSSHFKAKIHELPINDDCGFLSAGLFCGCVRFDRSLKTYVDHRFMILSVCVAQGFISLSLVHSIYSRSTQLCTQQTKKMAFLPTTTIRTHCETDHIRGDNYIRMEGDSNTNIKPQTWKYECKNTNIIE